MNMNKTIQNMNIWRLEDATRSYLILNILKLDMLLRYSIKILAITMNMTKAFKR